MNFTEHLENIFSQLRIEEVFTELDPKDKGRYYSLQCPVCKEHEAFLYKESKFAICSRKNNCGATTNLFDYYCERESIDIVEGLRNLANLTNYILPEVSPELLEVYAQKSARNKLNNDFLTICKTGLWKYGAKEVDYLHSRSYTDKEIISMEIGKLPDIEGTEQKLIEKGHEPKAVSNLLSSFRSSHPVIIPYKDKNGQIEGYVSRTIDKETEPKYLYSKGLQKGNYLFNYDRTKREQSLIIVEGILDALILRERGINNVVALGGVSFSDTQLSELLSNKKLKEVFLSLDNDTAGTKGTVGLINKLRSSDKNIFVVSPELYGEAKDPDELVRTKGIEAYRDAIKNAPDVVQYECEQILKTNDISTAVGKNRALNSLLDLEVLYSLKQSDIEADYVTDFIPKNLGIEYELFAKALEHREAQAKDKQAQERLSTATAKAQELLKKGDIDKATELLQTGIKEAVLDRSDLEIKPYTLNQLLEELRNEPETIKTGYANFDRKVAIPTGAVTIVAGRPSHGKTSLMLNLLLNMIYENPTKTFVFFSYEESSKFLSTKCIMNMSHYTFSNKEQNLKEYLRYLAGYQPEDIELTNGVARSLTHGQNIYDTWTKENRLILLSESYEVERLTAIIENLSTKYDIGAVFVDYIQKIPVAKYDNMRERVLKVSEKLRETAQNTNIPLIVGAQLNRESVTTGTRGTKGLPKLENLKEAGNIEEDANLVIAIHNYRTAKFELKEEDTDIKPNSKSTDPEDTDIDIMILKNRNGLNNVAIPMKFNAPIFKIKEK